MLVSRMFQTKIGIRKSVMPGARRQMMVVTKLTAPMIVPKPDSVSPIAHMSPPMPGEWSSLFSGAYANQPKSAAPSGVRNPPIAISEPNR